VEVAFAAPQDLSDGTFFDCVYVPTSQSWVARDLKDAWRYAQLVRKILP
jgi:hypothetical protein